MGDQGQLFLYIKWYLLKKLLLSTKNFSFTRCHSMQECWLCSPIVVLVTKRGVTVLSLRVLPVFQTSSMCNYFFYFWRDWKVWQRFDPGELCNTFTVNNLSSFSLNIWSLEPASNQDLLWGQGFGKWRF